MMRQKRGFEDDGTSYAEEGHLRKRQKMSLPTKDDSWKIKKVQQPKQQHKQRDNLLSLHPVSVSF